ncbi:MAG: polyphosphate polymerase domain-containing protein [Ruminococcaceae bacterium]|nr:polyphosphate polymerase domain-containing protein [Oscillospiraceae bacterium]
MSNTFRRMEKKTIVQTALIADLQARLSAHMDFDPHNADGKPYMISSLYYDGADDHVIRNSVALPYYKEKLRLRSYGVPTPDSTVFLELKKKQDGVGTKRRAKLPLRDAEAFLETGIHPARLSYIDEQVLREIDYYRSHEDVQPRVYVSYLRTAYHEKSNPSFRITFDSDILARRHDLRLELGRYGDPLLTAGYTLMEVKFSGAVPFWFSRVMSDFGLSFHTFSKVGTDFKLTSHARACAAHPEEAHYLRLIH